MTKEVNLDPSLLICCIYKITCLPTKDFYVGASKNFLSRKAYHETGIKLGNHSNPALAFLGAKYGLDSFCIEVLERCKDSMLEITEHRLIDSLQPNLNGAKPHGFNNDGKPRWLRPINPVYHLNVDGILTRSQLFERSEDWVRSEWVKSNRKDIASRVSRITDYQKLRLIEQILNQEEKDS